ncbi:NnrU family protein [Parasphingorhabdus sp.]|uniref:NnrU family protein n=1 Tax=Parasphingorhabdus sp. TaxID=2709688 RepID=UPI003C742DC3
MEMLIIGVSLWSLVHLMKSVTPSLRGSIQNAIGEGPHKGLVALTLLGSLALMILGWRSTPAEFVYDPPTWGRHANMALMFAAILLLGAAQGASRIRQWIRHPMLTGVLVWAVGHLLANGDHKSLVLFGGLGLWALISIITVSRNEGPWVKPAKIASFGRELLSLAIAAILYVILVFIHPWIAGVPVVAG